jgi:hypothetical protein
MEIDNKIKSRKAHALNSGFAKWLVSCLNEALCLVSSLVLGQSNATKSASSPSAKTLGEILPQIE